MEETVTSWSVELHLDEREGHTHAEAKLITGHKAPLTATGSAQLSERDPVDVPEIGFELAAARALRTLADRLLQVAEDDVEDLNAPH
jgi:hypothetical protein